MMDRALNVIASLCLLLAVGVCAYDSGQDKGYDRGYDDAFDFVNCIDRAYRLPDDTAAELAADACYPETTR